jgi:hypothetical protein
MIYFCCDELRRNAVDAHAALNGIDYLEVLDRDAPTGSPRQQTLLVRCLKAIPALTRDNVRIDGGERITPVKVLWAHSLNAIPALLITPQEQSYFTSLQQTDHVLVVRTDSSGDYSTYRLSLVKSPTDPAPPDPFDPMLSAVDFSFKVECPSDFDCLRKRICPPEPSSKPEISYLAKDYASFRRLMLDRMALLMPQWKERNTADMGIALVELLAYVGDYLSYQQDAAATEAYLGTARRRISVRRHARLVDYFMHDGCNARAWVQVQVSADNVNLAEGTQLFTRMAGQPARIPPQSQAYDQALKQGPVVFETMHPATLYQAHNELPFYAWGDQRCCLPMGAMRATLEGQYPDIKKGDVLLFEERLGPRTGQPQDADPTRRHAIRLTEVVQMDSSGNPLTDLLTGQLITEINWADEDALPFPFCLSTTTDEEHGKQYVEDVSVARGNIVLADHGLTIENESLGSVPETGLFMPPAAGNDPCMEIQPVPIPPRFRPRLKIRPLTQAAPYDSAAPASAAFRWKMKDVLPAVTLNSATWNPRRDLLASDEFAPEFVVEVEGDGTAYLRFGDDQHGLRPDTGATFTATYRVGNGVAGNVGAEAIAHIVTNESSVTAVRNPLPSQGGGEPETLEEARQRAPSAFRTQERAVTEEDYAEVIERDPGVQQAAATFRWTGSWHTVFLTVDRLGGLAVDDLFEKQISQSVERYRMAGYDLEVDGPRHVPLEIEMQVCVKPDYFRSDVKKAIFEVFGNRILPDGRQGVFHPDNFTFGQTVYLSRLYAAAQAVPGVASVHITKYHRQGSPDPKPLNEGKLTLGRLEIARLDNDPNFPERGVFQLNMGGGK